MFVTVMLNVRIIAQGLPLSTWPTLTPVTLQVSDAVTCALMLASVGKFVGLQPRSMFVGIVVKATLQQGTSTRINCTGGLASITYTTPTLSPHCACQLGALDWALFKIAWMLAEFVGGYGGEGPRGGPPTRM